MVDFSGWGWWICFRWTTFLQITPSSNRRLCIGKNVVHGGVSSEIDTDIIGGANPSGAVGVLFALCVNLKHKSPSFTIKTDLAEWFFTKASLLPSFYFLLDSVFKGPCQLTEQKGNIFLWGFMLLFETACFWFKLISGSCLVIFRVLLLYISSLQGSFTVEWRKSFSQSSLALIIWNGYLSRKRVFLILFILLIPAGIVWCLVWTSPGRDDPFLVWLYWREFGFGFFLV